MPFILMSFVLLLQLSFYIHDRAVLRSEAARAALELTAVKGDQKKLNLHGLTDRLLMGGTITASQEITSKRASVTLTCRVRQPKLSLLRPFTPGGFYAIEETAAAVITDPAGVIWKIRKLEHMTTGEERDHGNGSKTGASEKYSDR